MAEHAMTQHKPKKAVKKVARPGGTERNETWGED